MSRVRIYGKVLQRWYDTNENGRTYLVQRELAYKEYDVETGELVGAGSEDFSPERYAREISERWIYTWDGESRNAGGYRRFQDQGQIKFRRSEARRVKALLKDRYGAEIVELR